MLNAKMTFLKKMNVSFFVNFCSGRYIFFLDTFQTYLIYMLGVKAGENFKFIHFSSIFFLTTKTSESYL